MEQSRKEHNSPPLSEMFKTIPDVFGIRLNEQPEYKVLKKTGDFEVRTYEPQTLAQISVSGLHDEAIEKGYRTLADYIFGENTSQEKMHMTAPVYQEKKDGCWVTSFVIPAKYTLQSVPKPLNPQVHLIEKPTKTVVVYQYTGNNDEEKMREAELELEAWVKAQGITPISNYYWAQYDPPFTIPVLKRNEVLVRVHDGIQSN